MFLEVGNGERVLSWVLVTNVPVGTAEFCTRSNLTVSTVLHQVDLVLGVSWLKVANPLIDRRNGVWYLLSTD